MKKCTWFGLFLLTILASTGCDAFKSKETAVPKTESQAPADQSSAATTPPSVMAADAIVKIGSWSMTKDQFEERLKALKEAVPDYDLSNPQAKEAILEELISQQLLVMDGEKTGVAGRQEIKDAVEEFRRALIVREVATKLTDGVTVTEDEARQLYEQQKQIMRRPEEWHVREIVLADKTKANELLVELLSGKDFAQAAREVSISKSKDQGGDLGFINQVPFPEMATALMNLEAGDISSVFKGLEGFYIMKVEEKRGGEEIPFEEIKTDLMNNQLILKKQDVLLKHIDALKSGAAIEVNKDLL